MKAYSFFIKLLISSILLVAIPVTIIVAISNYEILRYSENDINNYGIGKLKLAENTLKQLQNTVYNDSVKLSVNNYINGLSNYGNNIDFKDSNNQLYIVHILDTLAELPKIDNKYKSVYLYLDNFKYAFTSEYEFTQKDMMADTGWLKYYYDYREKKSALTMLNARIPSNNNKEKNSSEDFVITYIYPLTNYTTSLNGALIVNLKEAEISALINSGNKNTEGYIFIINQDGEIVSHPDIKLIGTKITDNEYLKKIVKSKSQEGHLTSNINKNKSVVSYYKSELNNWTYVGIFPIGSLTSKVNALRLNTIYISLFIIIAGIFSAFIISKKIYDPVKEIIKEIKSVKRTNFNTNDDEVSILSKTFTELISEDKNLYDILEKNKREVKETYIRELIKGNTDSEINKNIVGDNFIYDSYICSVISIDRYKDFTQAYSREQQYHMKNLISQVIDEIIKSSFSTISCCIYEGEIAIIINASDKPEDIPLSLRLLFLKIQQELGKVLENSISVSIGTVHSGTQGIASSYSEAQTALKQKLKLGYGNIILWTEKFTDDYYYYYPIKIEELLLNYVITASVDDIKEILDELIDDLSNRSNLSSENVVQMFSQLLGNTAIKYLLEQHINIYDVFGGRSNLFNELVSKENIKEIRDWLEQVYTHIIQFCEKSQKNDKKYMKEIIEYISKNYNRDIGIKDVSEHVGLSYSHVRKIFKDEIGENIIDYINYIRINEAKKILTHMDICIKDIAMNLGYNNVQSFIRFFKKKEGITPGEYRNNIKASII